MEPFAIKQAAFLTSVGQGSAYPPAACCEIAIVGKSNVGKSSLINSLCNNKKLAKTSQTPGKQGSSTSSCSTGRFIWSICPDTALRARAKPSSRAGAS